jgi:hypothetical protein
MNRSSLIGLLIVGIVFFGSIAIDARHINSLQSSIGLVSEAPVSMALVSIAPIPISGEIAVDPVDRVLSPAEKTVFQFEKVNNITLYDDQKTVVEKIGQPDLITKDPFFKGTETYEYPKMNIGFYNGMIEYVEVLAVAGNIQIDDTSIPILVEDLKRALGEPDYVAEDGIVFQRNEALIKIFIEESTQKLISIDYYHLSST